jgi:protein TonB
MFDMVTGQARHIPNHNAVPLLLSSIAEAAAITLVVAVPLLFIAEQVPEVPSIIAFVAAAPPPPPPPPPPAPRAAAAAQPKAIAATGPTIPIEAPSEIRPEPAALPVDEGVPGGVEGGIPGGVVGGVLSGMIEAPPPPPPAPPAAPPRPVRIAGELRPPALLRRVEPEYPRLAVAANVTGVVILEATVDERGQVSDVRVLRSVHPLIDAEAVKAVQQWRYSPLTLNGHLAPFVLTVTLSFSLTQSVG